MVMTAAAATTAVLRAVARACHVAVDVTVMDVTTRETAVAVINDAGTIANAAKATVVCKQYGQHMKQAEDTVCTATACCRITTVIICELQCIQADEVLEALSTASKPCRQSRPV